MLIRQDKAMFYHKWRVVKSFEGGNEVGTICSYRDDYHQERQPYTETTPFTRLWKCRFYGDGKDIFEEYDASELAEHLSVAHRQGCLGPAPDQQPTK